MYKNKSIAVVVPAYNEEIQIKLVIDQMPDYVDRIIIVNDCSTDQTAQVVQNYLIDSDKRPLPNPKSLIEESVYSQADIMIQKLNAEEINYFAPSEVVNDDEDNDRIILINNLVNTGVGGAIARGYKWCKDHEIDCTAVMAGDAQMDPAELIDIISPVVEENVDYVKGNRLKHPTASLIVPRTRFFGNATLSILTKIASGYWHISDTQTGFTAISKSALNQIKLYKIYKRYGMPNDLLVRLNIASCSLKEVGIKPIYNVGEQSKMRPMRVIPSISWLLLRSFGRRLWVKYLFRDFHPLFLLYNLGFLLLTAFIPVLLYMIPIIFRPGESVSISVMFIAAFLLITGLQSLFFAMWMDIGDNQKLYKY
ncbi:MAG: glycosyltransferase family 2 protein [Bacteroidetes bacterium]|nr:glycosyltransferase family 2 protein [Bacteroidota bacterium]MBT4970665.1 glycosyltransferase family 2 protein [Bacteroidota bacterium]MBT6836497.1 glycosyltransferase family 2 protein [Bacteroidota bacterium]